MSSLAAAADNLDDELAKEMAALEASLALLNASVGNMTKSVQRAEADAALDGFVSGSKAVLFSDGSAASQSAIEALKVSKTTKYTEVRLDQQPESGALVGSLKRRIGVSPPALIVNGAVFDAKRIDYLVKQDMMLPVFRAAGTSGEIRLPFQDLRFYLAKTIN